MEIQHGKGPWADPVAGIVPLGTTLTMVVGINDKLGNMTDILNWHLSLFMINLRLNTDWRTTVIHNFRFQISALGWLSLAASRLFANFVQKLSIAASCISCLLSPHQCDYNTTIRQWQCPSYCLALLPEQCSHCVTSARVSLHFFY